MGAAPRSPSRVRARAVDVVGSPVLVTSTAILLALALRLPFLQHVAYPDEGGMILVVRHWHEGGPSLYGTLFVDRPPGLLLFWKLAVALGGLQAGRVLALLTTAILVAAAAGCGHLLAGRRGTAWAALVAAALAGNPLLGTVEVNAELIGAPLTMLGCLALLTAVRRPAGRRDDLLLLLSGAAAAGALLVKQNLADAFVLGVVVAVSGAATGAWTRGRALRIVALGATGALVPVAATVIWAATEGPGVRALWFTLYQFRVDAAAVMVGHSAAENSARAVGLLGLTLLSGIALVVLSGLWALAPRARRADPVTLGVLSMLAFEVVAVALGGSYWSHYLVGLVPGVALVTAAAAAAERRRLPVLPGVAVVLASAVVATTIRAAAYAPPEAHLGRAVAGWLQAASRPGDTAVVAYGRADILEAAGLTPGYPYLWTLPMRTLDPDLDRLVRRLSGPRAPTWVVQTSPLDSWGIDPHARMAHALAAHYRLVETVCRVPVYLHRGVHRDLPPVPAWCRVRPL